MATTKVLGRGKLYAGEFTGDAKTTPPAENLVVFIGNVPELTLTAEQDVLDHKDYTEGLRTIDDEVTLEGRYTVAFNTDHITDENIAKLLAATVVGGEIRMYTNIETRWLLRFYQNNAIGPNRIWQFNKVKLSSGGAFGLIADDWQKIPITGKGFKDADNYPNSPFVTVYTTSTTTTTTE
jgi:hypothetical protein